MTTTARDNLRLPLELLERVLDLVGDRRTLGACGLTCHALSKQTRKRLFGLTKIAPIDYTTFLNVLEHSSYLSNAVARLSVVQPQFVCRRRWNDAQDPALLVRILQRLPRLRAFAVTNLGEHTMSDALRSALPALLPRVEELHISCCYLSPEDFMHIVCACPSLRELRYLGRPGTEGNMPSAKFMDAMRAQVGRRIALRHLTWLCLSPVHHSACLLQGPFDLRPTSMDVLYVGAVGGTQALITVAGPTMKHLTLRASSADLDTLTGEQSFVDTAACPVLASLYIHALGVARISNSLTMLRRVEASCAHLERLYMRLSGTVRLRLAPIKEEAVLKEQLTILDDGLARFAARRWAAGRLVVTIYVDTPALHRGSSAYLMSVFPLCERHFPAFLATGSRLRVLGVGMEADFEKRVPFETWPLEPVFDSDIGGERVPEMDVSH